MRSFESSRVGMNGGEKKNLEGKRNLIISKQTIRKTFKMFLIGLSGGKIRHGQFFMKIS
jgi:hypothetical protein